MVQYLLKEGIFGGKEDFGHVKLETSVDIHKEI